MNADEIVRALRACGGGTEGVKITRAAADLIESLQAQLAGKTALIEATIAGQETLQKALAASQARERAAVKDIMCRDHCDVCVSGKEHEGECKIADYDCQTCKSETCRCRECRDEDKWQWRGPMAGEGEAARV